MIIVNADDWGRTAVETDAALACHARGTVTSVTAMVFMEDTERAARLALYHGLEVGLHLNLSQPYTSAAAPAAAAQRQLRVSRFINASRYSVLLYNPMRRRDFIATYEAQYAEFVRLYGKRPTHIDGHHHKHLCSNLLLEGVIPAGEKVRRSFFFWPEEKSLLNRSCRRLTNHLLARRYRVTDYFFALSQCLHGERLTRVLALARSHEVELMAHPAMPGERERLMSAGFAVQLAGLESGGYSSL